MRLASRCAYVLALASFSGSWLGGCGADNQDPQRDPSEREEGRSGSADRGSLTIRAFESAADAGLAASDSDAASADEAVGQSEDAGLDYSDGELVGMAIAIHEAETLLARAAARSTTEPRLQILSADVLAAHEEGRTRALLLGLLPVPSQQSRDYLESALSLRTNLLAAEPGETLDRAYLEYQIMLDAILVHHIEHLWLPIADAPELQSELRSSRESLQVHLDRGVALRSELYPAASDPAVDAGTTADEEPDSEGVDAGSSQSDSDAGRAPAD